MLLRETGARAAHLPVWETLCCGVLTLRRGRHRRAAGRAAARRRRRRRRAHAGPARGRPRADRGRPRRRTPTARSPAARSASPTPTEATRLLVTARDGDRDVVALVDPHGPGVTLRRVGLLGADHPAHRRPRRRARRAARRRRRARSCVEHAVAGLALTRRRRRRGRPRPDRRLHQGPRAVRPRAGAVPGRRDAGRRRLHRLAHPRPRRRQRRLAGRRRPRRHRRPRRRGVLGRAPRAPTGAAHLPPPARRHGRRRDLPAAPLLLVGQRHRPRARHAAPATSRSRTRPPRTSS